jgi:hypothetical protein
MKQNTLPFWLYLFVAFKTVTELRYEQQFIVQTSSMVMLMEGMVHFFSLPIFKKSILHDWGCNVTKKSCYLNSSVNIDINFIALWSQISHFGKEKTVPNIIILDFMLVQKKQTERRKIKSSFNRFNSILTKSSFCIIFCFSKYIYIYFLIFLWILCVYSNT